MKTRTSRAFSLMVLLFGIVNSSLAQNWNEIIKQASPDVYQVYDGFGSCMSLDGNNLIIGAPLNYSTNSQTNTLTQSGAAYIFEKDALGNWLSVQKLFASDRQIQAFFGNTVSISGNTAVVGALYESKDEQGQNLLPNSGAVYIFTKEPSGLWVEKQKLVASDRSIDAKFGESVSISGNTIVIGASGEQKDIYGSGPLSNAGAIYVFKQNTIGVWVEEQKLVASDRSMNAEFGGCVSILGNTIIVGAESEQKDISGSSSISNAGATYVFEKNFSGLWVEKQKLVASDRSIGANFGNSISISGNIVVIGATRDRFDENGNNILGGAGASYIFSKNLSGLWVEDQKIVASDRYIFANFGNSVSISGKTIIVGAKGDVGGNTSLSSVGASYIFQQNSSGVWLEEQKLVASNPMNGAKFGESVFISGNTVLVGNSKSEVYFFEKNPCANLSIAAPKSTLLCDQDVTVSATAAATSGTPPYFYSWSNGSTNATISNLSNGTYDVTITDNNGCTLTDQVVVDDSDFRNIDLKLIREDCGRSGLDPLDAQLNYQAVTIADNYKYRINGGSIVDLEKNSGNDDNFNLNETSSFEVNTTYTIEVAAHINGGWTAFGTPCTISTQTPSEIRLKLLAADCGREGADPTNTRLFFERRIDATAYQVKIENTTLGYSHTLTESAGSNSVNLGHYPNIEYNTTYDVSVSAEVDGVWSTGGAVCQVTTADINSRVNLTLRDEYCGKTNLDPDNARLDFWKRWGANDPDHQVMLNGPGVNHQVISRGTQGVFNLRHFSGVQFDATYTVKIRAHVDGNTWSAWGDICEVKTASMNEVVNAKLDCYSCGQTNLNPSSSTADIYFVRRHDATDHKVYINGPGVNNLEILVGTSGAFPISQITGMQYNATYIVKVAALIDNVWSAYGDVCTLSTKADPSLSPPPPVSGARVKNSGTAATNQVQSAVDQTANPILVYPNPVQQGDLNLQFSPLSTAPIQIVVCDILGKTVYSKSFSNNGQEDQLFKIAIGSQIPNGIYTITVLDGNQELHTKVVVE